LSEPTTSRFRRWGRPSPVVPVGVFLGTLLGVLISSCRDGSPTGPDLADLEIVIVQGDAQAAEPGATLPLPLMVRVQDVSTGRGMERVGVAWELLGGAGARVEPLSAVTDSLGMASARVTLGSALGTYLVRASVAGMQSPPADFQAVAILMPELSEIPSASVRVGDTILLRGRNFSVNPGQNVVTFSGIRGRVVSASSLELRVEVPPCLPERAVTVRVQIGTLSTPGFYLEVEGQSGSLFLSRGEDLVLDAADGLSCLFFPSVPGTAYLVVPHSTSTLGGAVHQYSLVGLGVEGMPPPATSREAAVQQAAGPEWIAPGQAMSDTGPQERWDRWVRSLEGRLLEGEDPLLSTGGLGDAPRGVAPFAGPVVGDVREFNVLRRDNTFDRVTARLRHIGLRALIFLDESAPTGGLSDADILSLALEFDEFIHPTVTGAFGEESDLDGNGRVVILLTPSVNRLTPPGSDSFVGGFFFGLDLLRGRSGSNEGEIFYALVPDPLGQEGPVLPRSTVMETLPPVLAHEFQHMVHFNQRNLLGGASNQEALWLSEALAQMAEDLVGAAFAQASRPDKAYQYQVGNWGRARRFLQNPSAVSVLASISPGTLAERGAGWLLLKQLSGQTLEERLLLRLTASTLTGVANLTSSVGPNWETLVADWAGALYLDGTGIPVRPRLQVPGIDLRQVLSGFDGTYPLKPRAFGASSFVYNGSLWSSAPDFFIITPPASGGLALAAAGPAGRPPESAMNLRVLVVRLQ
jgi:hypothetical protein